jgi:hypothetical protein
MAIDMFATRTMLAAIEQMRKPPRFLDGVIFKRQQPSLTEYIDIDVIKGGKVMAPFVSSTVQGRVIKKDNTSTKSYKPPYIKLKDITTAEDVLKRQPGEHVYYQGGQTPAQRAQMQLGKDIKRFMDMVDFRIEYMCSTALDTGIVTANGDGISMTFDFGMPAEHKLGVSDISASWDDGGTASDPIQDLRDLAHLIFQTSGVWPNVCVLSAEAAAEFMSHTKVANNNALSSTVQINQGTLAPEMMDNGVTNIGYLKALNLNLYAYNEIVTDPDTGSDVRLMPAKKLWMGNTNIRNEIHFGGIKDLSAVSPLEYFPKTWIDNDPSARILLLQSAPLVALHQPDCWASVQVIT